MSITILSLKGAVIKLLDGKNFPRSMGTYILQSPEKLMAQQ
jgi:hypothetical protein